MPESRPAGDHDSTADLLVLVRQGSDQAREQIIRRYLPILERWASGRLPRRARSMHDTGDLVQDTLIKALRHLDRFEYRREGAFLAFLRTSLLNRMRDLINGADAGRPRVELPAGIDDGQPSPLEQAIGAECLAAYESGLERLSSDQRQAVILRVEMGFTYAEIARAIGRPSANAARMLVSRGILKLAEVMDHATE